MRTFFNSQIFIYLFLVCPDSGPYRLGLLIFWAVSSAAHPVVAGLGAAWQIFSLNADIYIDSSIQSWFPRVALRCDSRLWFICSSQEPNVLLQYLFLGKIGQAAGWIKIQVETLCLAWHPVWGNLAFSLIMGGRPAETLKGLYGSLGFLHVLVISGSQFTLLSKWLRWLCRFPAIGLYALSLIDWRVFRPLSFLADLMTLMGLLAYLLACGASPPCQRAFLEQLHQFYLCWCRPLRIRPASTEGGPWVFRAQVLLFPTDWFSLSALLSWGAVYALKIFARRRSLLAQLRTSISIQILNLGLFCRLSIASLLFDFFVSPIWDIVLFTCLMGIFLPNLQLQQGMTWCLDHFHNWLWQVDLWQATLFGSSTLNFRTSVAWWGRLAALMVFVWLFLSHRDRANPRL